MAQGNLRVFAEICILGASLGSPCSSPSSALTQSFVHQIKTSSIPSLKNKESLFKDHFKRDPVQGIFKELRSLVLSCPQFFS
jgi:hypothetical protein